MAEERKMASKEKPPLTPDQKLGIFSVIVVSICVIAGLVFLIFVARASWTDTARRKSCIVGSAALVYPGPGNVSPSAYWEGAITFDQIEHTIDWKMRHGGLGAILAIDLLGPIDPNASPPTDAPVYLTLCGPPSLVMCILPEPHLLKQSIKQSSPQNQGLDAYINAFAADRSDYLLRVRTADFPNGALVARLNSAC